MSYEYFHHNEDQPGSPHVNRYFGLTLRQWVLVSVVVVLAYYLFNGNVPVLRGGTVYRLSPSSIVGGGVGLSDTEYVSIDADL